MWSFTVEPFAYPIGNVTATASHADPGSGPENTVNGSGLNAQGQHSVDAPDMWLAAPNAGEPAWIQYEFDGVYKLHEMQVWNYNVAFELVLGFGLRDVTVEYSTDGVDWSILGDVEFAQASATSTYTANTVVNLEGVAARYVRLTINSAWGVMGQYGLSEVRFFSIPVQAREPQPADREADVEPDITLSWRTGREAAAHDVYLSDDETAVTDGTALVDTATENTYETGTLGLELNTTYYWRIDEINEAQPVTTWAGNVWSFSTQPYIVVDDFESYTDDMDAGETIYQTWIDGLDIPGNGAQVGYLEAPFAEQTIVNSGRQSMPLLYENGAAGYSEAERVFDAAQDWTRAGIATLVVHFFGDAANAGGQIYAMINGVKVSYDGDSADMMAGAWVAWTIDLTSLGTNLSNVRTLAIGVDGGGSGTLYVDDIRLLPAVASGAVSVTVRSADSIEATGSDGMLLSVNGTTVEQMILGATTEPAAPTHADLLPEYADDFDLSTYASSDNQAFVMTMFDQAVDTIFIIERNGNDAGYIQALDANGDAIGNPAAFAVATWLKTDYTIADSQIAAGIVITAATPIYGIKILPPDGGDLGIDSAVVAAIAAE